MSVAILTPLVIYFNVVGVAINILILAMLPIAAFLFFFRKRFSEFFKFTSLVKLTFSEKRDVMKIGVVSLLATLMHQGALITIRRFIIDEFGETDNGIYQSVLGISLNYFAIIYAILANYTLPKFSSLKDNLSLNSEINDNFRFLMIIIIPSVLLIFSYRDIVLQIIYTGEFLKAADLFLFQMIGDIFRMMAALFGLWLIPRMKILPLVSIDFIFNLTLVTLPVVLVNFYKHDLSIIPFCYMIAFFVHFSLFFIYTKRKLNFNFKSENMKIIYYGVTIVILGFIISSFFVNYGHFVVLGLVAVWLLTVFSKDEKNKILSKLSDFRFFKK